MDLVFIAQHLISPKKQNPALRERKAGFCQKRQLAVRVYCSLPLFIFNYFPDQNFCTALYFQHIYMPPGKWLAGIEISFLPCFAY
jgi:hypothetical protein